MNVDNTVTVNNANIVTGKAGVKSDILSFGNMVSSQSVSVSLTCTLPFGELNRFYHAIENALPDIGNKVVQVASPYDAEGASVIAFEAAVVAALAGKRVLFINTTPFEHATARKLDDAVAFPLNTLFTMGKSFNEVMVFAQRTNLFYSVLRTEGENAVTLNDLVNIHELLNALRQYYELIVIDSVNILGGTFGLSLAKMVDGTVMVLEAEATRAPVALQASKMLHESDGKVIGAVLNRRRFYIPQRLYRWLYQ